MRTSYSVVSVGGCQPSRIYDATFSLFEDISIERTRTFIRQIKDSGRPLRVQITKRTEPWTEFQRRMGVDSQDSAILNFIMSQYG